MGVQDEINIQEGRINQKSNNAMSVILCTGATFVKKNSCPVARRVSFDTASMHLLTFRVLEPYLSKDIELDLSHVSHINDVIIVASNYVLFESILPSFPAAKI